MLVSGPSYAVFDPVKRRADLVVESVKQVAEQALQPLIVGYLVEAKAFGVFEKH